MTLPTRLLLHTTEAGHNRYSELWVHGTNPWATPWSLWCEECDTFHRAVVIEDMEFVEVNPTAREDVGRAQNSTQEKGIDVGNEVMNELNAKNFEIVMEALRGLASTQSNQTAAEHIRKTAVASLVQIIDTYEGAAQADFVQHMKESRQLVQAEAEYQQVLGALHRWGRHETGCTVLDTSADLEGHRVCSCGLTKAAYASAARVRPGLLGLARD